MNASFNEFKTKADNLIAKMEKDFKDINEHDFDVLIDNLTSKKNQFRFKNTEIEEFKAIGKYFRAMVNKDTNTGLIKREFTKHFVEISKNPDKFENFKRLYFTKLGEINPDYDKTNDPITDVTPIDNREFFIKIYKAPVDL